MVATILGQTWCLEGVLVPFEVSSGSMAETLLGPHWDVVCGDCGLRFAHGADAPRGSETAVCPNCGYREHRLPSDGEVSGDRLLVHKSVCALRSPRRWEVVAFRRFDGKGRIYVKRIVGLPGELVQIRDGDVYINGEIQARRSNSRKASRCWSTTRIILPQLTEERAIAMVRRFGPYSLDFQWWSIYPPRDCGRKEDRLADLSPLGPFIGIGRQLSRDPDHERQQLQSG